jgi:hypothetical protein
MDGYYETDHKEFRHETHDQNHVRDIQCIIIHPQPERVAYEGHAQPCPHSDQKPQQRTVTMNKWKVTYHDDEYRHGILISTEDEEPLIDYIRTITVGNVQIELDDDQVVDYIIKAEE